MPASAAADDRHLQSAYSAHPTVAFRRRLKEATLLERTDIHRARTRKIGPIQPVDLQRIVRRTPTTGTGSLAATRC
jgi:hypothetical protein